jgi:hypothetical protein
MTRDGNRIQICEYARLHYNGRANSNYSKYNFGTKKRKLAEDRDDRQLEESVRTISDLFSQAGNGMAPASTALGRTDEPLEARVASISAEIAAAIAQAHSRECEDDEDGSGSASGSGRDVPDSDTIGPNTSGIRGGGALTSSKLRNAADDVEDDDSDTFPIPLRTRKTGKDGRVAVGKRKR